MIRASRHSRFLSVGWLLLALLTVQPALVAQRNPKLGSSKKAQDREASLVFNTASRFYRQENWRDAASAFGDFLKRFSRHGDALEARFARGYCYNRLGDHLSAVADLKLAGGGKKSRWTADANFYLGRSLEALAAKTAKASEVERAKHLREAATSYGVAAGLRAKSVAALPASTPAKDRAGVTDLYLQALVSQGEAYYNAAAHDLAIKALGPLLAGEKRLSGSGSFSRGVYFLALSNYAVDLAAETSGKPTTYDGTLSCLAKLTGKGREADSFWAESVFLQARITHRLRRWSAAIGLYGRLVGRDTPQAPDAAYYRALALYEMGTGASSGGETSLQKAAAGFLAFHRAHPKHTRAVRARYYEALAHFNRQDYATASSRLREFTSNEENKSKGSEFLSQAWLSLGQALLLAETPAAGPAAEALATAARLATQESNPAKAARARYWQGEALFSVALENEDPGKRRDAFGKAAVTLGVVAGAAGKAVPTLQEEALHKQSDALFRAGAHVECASVAKLYRRTYPAATGGSSGGRFYVESLKLSGRNALRAPAETVTEAERRSAARYYAEAATLVNDVKENRRLRYLSGVSHYYNEDFSAADAGLTKVYGDLVDDSESRGDFEELPFFLADSRAQQPRPKTPDAQTKQRILDAAALFEEYLLRAAKTPGKSTARHVATARINQGLCYQWAGDLAGSRKSYAAFLTTHPNHDLASRIRFSLAGVCLDLDSEADALREYTAVAQTSEDLELVSRSLLQSASLLRRSDRAKEALPILTKALVTIGKLGDAATVSKLKLDASFQRSMALVEAAQAVEARKALAVYLADFPGSVNDVEVRLQLAYLALDDGAAQDALTVLEPLCAAAAEAAKITDRDEALYLRAWSYGALADQLIAAQGDKEIEEGSADARQLGELHSEMESTYRRLISEYPASGFALDGMLELGQHLYNSGSFSEAKKWFSMLRAQLDGKTAAVADRGPELLERSLYGLAFISYEEKEYVEARALFDRVAERKESKLAPRATFQAARSWMLSRGDREAVERFQRVVGVLKTRASDHCEESLLRLGECHHRLGEYALAAKVLEQLLEEFSDGDLRHEARFALGFSQQYMDGYENATKNFRQVVKDTRGVVASRAQYHVGECFMDQKKYRQAAREFLVVVANFDFDGGSDDSSGGYRDWFRRSLLAAGIAYQADGDLGAAKQQWKELIDRFPESPEGKAATTRVANAGKNEKKK